MGELDYTTLVRRCEEALEEAGVRNLEITEVSVRQNISTGEISIVVDGIFEVDGFDDVTATYTISNDLMIADILNL